MKPAGNSQKTFKWLPKIPETNLLKEALVTAQTVNSQPPVLKENGCKIRWKTITFLATWEHSDSVRCLQGFWPCAACTRLETACPLLQQGQRFWASWPYFIRFLGWQKVWKDKIFNLSWLSVGRVLGRFWSPPPWPFCCLVSCVLPCSCRTPRPHSFCRASWLLTLTSWPQGDTCIRALPQSQRDDSTLVLLSLPRTPKSHSIWFVLSSSTPLHLQTFSDFPHCFAIGCQIFTILNWHGSRANIKGGILKGKPGDASREGLYDSIRAEEVQERKDTTTSSCPSVFWWNSDLKVYGRTSPFFWADFWAQLHWIMTLVLQNVRVPQCMP